MLPQNALVRTRKEIEKTYIHTCDIYEDVEVLEDDYSTTFSERLAFEKQPCRISYKTISSTNMTDNASAISQSVKLFISPALTVKAGSKIIVAKDNEILSYKNSGVVAKYPTHQEIMLELYEEWA